MKRWVVVVFYGYDAPDIEEVVGPFDSHAAAQDYADSKRNLGAYVAELTSPIEEAAA